MRDDSTAVLPGHLERAMTGDAEARERLLELTRDRLMGHARRFLHAVQLPPGKDSRRLFPSARFSWRKVQRLPRERVYEWT